MGQVENVCVSSEHRGTVASSSWQWRDSWEEQLFSQAMEAVEKLRSNLRQEQIMLVQTMCATFQQHLAPHQVRALHLRFSNSEQKKSAAEHVSLTSGTICRQQPISSRRIPTIQTFL